MNIYITNGLIIYGEHMGSRSFLQMDMGILIKATLALRKLILLRVEYYEYFNKE